MYHYFDQYLVMREKTYCSKNLMYDERLLIYNKTKEHVIITQ